jgi:hypothetical protein
MIEETPIKVDIFLDSQDGSKRYYATEQVVSSCSTCLRGDIWMKVVLA